MKIQSLIILGSTPILLILFGLISIVHAETILLSASKPTSILLAPNYPLAGPFQQTLVINDLLSACNQVKFGPLTISDSHYKLGQVKALLAQQDRLSYFLMCL